MLVSPALCGQHKGDPRAWRSGQAGSLLPSTPLLQSIFPSCGC